MFISSASKEKSLGSTQKLAKTHKITHIYSRFEIIVSQLIRLPLGRIWLSTTHDCFLCSSWKFTVPTLNMLQEHLIRIREYPILWIFPATIILWKRWNSSLTSVILFLLLLKDSHRVLEHLGTPVPPKLISRRSSTYHYVQEDISWVRQIFERCFVSSDCNLWDRDHLLFSPIIILKMMIWYVPSSSWRWWYEVP